jgi:hypothetical protein
MQYFYLLGAMDAIWSSSLELTPHQLVLFSDVERTITWSKSRGHLWVPPNLSAPRFDAGILRKQRAVMKKYLSALSRLDFHMILKYLDENGKTDWAREKKTYQMPVTTPLGVTAGGSHRNLLVRRENGRHGPC